MVLEKLNAHDILNLMSGLSDTAKDTSVIVLDSVTSTNDYLLELLKEDNELKPQTAVLAEMQSAGKGRQGRLWVSPPGNIYLSLYRPFNCTLDKLYGLSLVVGIGIARVLQNHNLPDVKLKWPNDILWQERKLGGILIETRANKNGMVDVVIGLGLNINDMDAYKNDISQKYVSLESAVQHKIYRNELVAHLLVELNKILQQFADNSFDVFVNEWKSLEFIMPESNCSVH